MKSFVQNGDVLQLVAPYDVASGAGALVGSQFGVATSAVTSGATGEFMTVGVHSLAKTSAQAWTQGQKIYWDNTNKRLDSDGTLGQFVGLATEAAANPSGTGKIKLCDATVLSQGTQGAISAVATANATDLASAEALANQLKTSLNLVIAALHNAGITG